MTDFNLIMNIGNIIAFLGTCLLIKDVLKNRNALKGYSIIGSLLTFIAVSLFQAGFFMMGVWTWTIGMVTAFYWLVAFLFSFREKFRAWRDRRKGEQYVYKMLGCKNKKEAMKLRDAIRLVPSEPIFTDEKTEVYEVYCGRCGLPHHLCVCGFGVTTN
jgi:hypothetical protein